MNDFLKTWETSHQRVIVLAGVFDPVHKGHIDILKKAVTAYGGLGVLLPERVPQHKHGTTAYEHRLEMLKISVKDVPELSVLDYPEDQHMISEVFDWLGDTFPEKTFGWVVGVDVAEHMFDWPDIEKISALNVDKLIVASRHGKQFKGKPKPVFHGVRIERIKSKHNTVTSSFVRMDLIHRHTSLPDGVYDYIKQNNLYLSEE